MYHKLFKDALHPWKRCIAKGGIFVYWRACRWYDWIRFNSAKLLSTTCSTANISVATMDSSPPKLMHTQFRDALPPRKRCIAKGCTSVYSREWGWVLVVRDQQCWAVEHHMQNCEHQCSNGEQLTPKILLTLLRGPLHPWKQCIAKGCISVYSREHGCYD